LLIRAQKMNKAAFFKRLRDLDPKIANHWIDQYLQL